MSAQLITQDSRVRSLFVLVPAFCAAGWIASELASDEFIWPVVVLLGFVALVFFSVFVRSVRFEFAVLILLLTGYLIGNRGFASLTVAKPFYPGEVGLAVITVALLARFILTREMPDFKGFLSRLILIFCALGAVRLYLDYPEYKMDAIRDSALVYYSLYFFFGREMALQAEARSVLEKSLGFTFLALVPIAVVERVAPDAFQSNGQITMLFQKDDLLTTFAAVGVFVLYTRPKIYRWKWLRSSLIIFYIAYVFNGLTRASLAALIIGSIPLLVAGRRKFLWYPAVAVVLGVTVLAGLSVTFEGSNTTDPQIIVEKLVSMVDITGTGSYNSDFGELKANNNQFRRTLWQSFFEDTNSVSPTFGRGFGYDFVARYSELYRYGEYEGLRSAHNFYVTLYGRMGIIGSLVFLAITWQVVAGGFRAAAAVRRGWMPLSDLSFWCATWAVLVASVFGVVLEGPIGAIVFWTFLGIGVRVQQTADAERSHALQMEAHEAFVPPATANRPALTYGAA